MPNIDATVALFKGVDSLPVTVESELYERIFVMPENPGTPEGPQCARQIIENVTFKFAGQDGAVSLPGGGYEIPGLPNPESCHDLNSNK